MPQPGVDDAMTSKDDRAEKANKFGGMGPGHVGENYAHQHSDTGRSGGTYGDPLAGSPHQTGRHGDHIYGRVDGGSSGVPVDPTQRQVTAGAATDGRIDVTGGGARAPDSGQNAQIVGGSPDAPIGRGTEDERSAPGISTDKRSDDTRPG